MAREPNLTIPQRLARRINNLILTTLVPVDRPSRIFAWIFRLPLLLSDLGLTVWIPGWILILTTTGRYSGKPRRAAVEFLRPPGQDSIWVMSGWAGNTDWYRNACAQPRVGVQIGHKRFEAMVRPLNDEETLFFLTEILRYNPMATAIFTRWTGKTITSDITSLRSAVHAFPALALMPVQDPRPINRTSDGASKRSDSP